jgi:hypothetical protein
MPRAYVGDGGDGRFSAHVEYDEDSPFSYVEGPTGVGPEEAIAWGRRHAERVTVRVGVDFYSAGAEPVRNLPGWSGHGDDRELSSEPAADLSGWEVEGRTESVPRRQARLPRRAKVAAGLARAADFAHRRRIAT